jgi:NTE family protein
MNSGPRPSRAMRLLPFVLLAMLTLLCAACTISAGRERTTPREVDQQSRATGVPLTAPFVERDGNDGDALVGVAISGGGSRAANFAAAVMAELDRMGLLRKVTAISSVSGGSVAATYFAVHGRSELRTRDPDAFWGLAKETLSQDFRSKWLARWLRPDQLMSTFLSGTTRTDVLADIFDETFLGGATFSSLAGSRPALFVDATVINDQPGRLLDRSCTNRGLYAQRLRWESVSFTDEFFSSCLNASFDSFRISSALAASAAFPGVFNSVTLKRFDFGSNEPSYVHLIDGGPSDNLGMDGILGAIVPQGRVFAASPSACLLIVVDAFTVGDADLRHEQADLRGVLGRVIDLNFFDSVDAMLARRRHDTLQRLGLPPTRQLDMFGGYLRKQDFPVEGQYYTILKPSKRFTASVSASAAMGEAADPRGVHCAVWHIALDNVPSLMAGQGAVDGQLVTLYNPKTIADKFIQTEDWFQRADVQHRVRVYELASRLRTDFNLTGPEHCAREQLRDGVWEAGRLAVQDDWTSRRAVCDWFRARGWLVAPTCDAPPMPAPALPFRIGFSAAGKKGGSYEVVCSPAADLRP